jgi:SAM-dependent methyltransferase
MNLADRNPNAYYQSKLGVAFYDLFTREAHDNGPVKVDLDFYLECAREFGGPVLELATGTGRVLLHLARSGFEVAGIDASDRMLAIARAKASSESAETKSRVRFHRKDMASFQLDEFFRLAIVPFRAFQHLVRPEMQRAALRCVYRSLVAGGHFVVDVFDPRLEHCVPGAPSPNSERRLRDPKTGHTVVRRVIERINDPVLQLVSETYRIEELDEDGNAIASEESSWTLRWATRQEMRYLFELSGFEVIAEYSDFFRSPPSYGEEQLWIVRKI